MDTITPEMLQAVAGNAALKATETPHTAITPPTPRNGSGFDVEGFMSRNGIQHRGAMEYNGGKKWQLEECPFEPTHKAPDSVIYKTADGKLGFKCSHNTCSGKHWQDVREKYEPGYIAERDRKQAEWEQRHTTITPQYSDSKRTGVIEWNSPQALPNTLPPVAPFDMALMPEALREFVADVADRVQCPPDFVGVALMVCLSAVIGRSVGIRPKRHDDWLVIVNLWGAIVGRPGIMKTPALSSVTAFTGALEARAREEFERATKESEALAMVGKEAKKQTEGNIRKALKAGNEESAKALALQAVNDEHDQPVRKRYKTNDGTIEKLGEILRDSPRGLLVLRDELTGWLRGLDREGREESRAFYLEAWNGDGSFTFDRIGRGTVDIPSTTIAMLGGIQPGPLSGYLSHAARGGAGDDGLLQRFQLLVWPDVSHDWNNVDRWPDTDAKGRVRDIFERLDSLDPASIGAESDTAFDDHAIPFLHFDDDAQALFNDWRGDLERKIRAGNESPAIEAHLSKYRSLAPSLALICHMVDNPNGGPIGEQSLIRALAWCQYLETHARRLYAQTTDTAIVAAVDLDKHIMAGDLDEGFSIRDVYRKGWSGLDKETAWSALRVLEDFDRVARVTHQSDRGGPKSITWCINPALMEG